MPGGFASYVLLAKSRFIGDSRKNRATAEEVALVGYDLLLFGAVVG